MTTTLNTDTMTLADALGLSHNNTNTNTPMYNWDSNPLEVTPFTYNAIVHDWDVLNSITWENGRSIIGLDGVERRFVSNPFTVEIYQTIRNEWMSYDEYCGACYDI